MPFVASLHNLGLGLWTAPIPCLPNPHPLSGTGASSSSLLDRTWFRCLADKGVPLLPDTVHHGGVQAILKPS